MSYHDEFLVKKLREILLRLYPTPKSSLLSEPHPQGEELSWGSLVNFSSSEGGHDPYNKGLVLGNVSYGENGHSLKKNLQEFIQVLKMSLGPSPKPNSVEDLVESGGQELLDLNLSSADILDLNALLQPDEGDRVWEFRTILIITLYIIICCVSVVGNLLVVQLVIRSRRLHTLTHALLANLAVADLFMATLNIPFSAARVIMTEWPFGEVLCHLVPWVQVTSVYVTSITMAVIAVIMNPLGSRMKSSLGVVLVGGIWSLSAALSLPYAIHHKVWTTLTVRVVKRCQFVELGSAGRRWLTVGTFLAQYLIPLTLTTVSYLHIMHRLSNRDSDLGSTTPRQQAAQSKGKKKTIKMLALTVLFFAGSWAPINIYHLLTHFSVLRPNSSAILICHLIAMSSCTVNPFIYCWFNEHFRREATKWARCFRTRRCPIVHPGLEVGGTTGGGVGAGCQNPVAGVPAHSATFVHSIMGVPSGGGGYALYVKQDLETGRPESLFLVTNDEEGQEDKRQTELEEGAV